MRTTRRKFLSHWSGLLIAGGLSAKLAANANAMQDTRATKQTPKTELISNSVITVPEAGYCGWPTITKRSNGELVVAYSGRRESHVCPFGTVELIRSSDNGKNWTWPQTIYDSPIDDRDCGVMETTQGSLLVTSFTSLAYKSSMANLAKWDAGKQKRWSSIDSRISAEQQKKELGTWLFRSVDGGVTWSKRIDSIVNSPHGPIQLRDGRLLYPGKKLWNAKKKIGIAESLDDGKTWNWKTEIPTRDGDSFENYHELHGVEAADGTIVVQIRNHNSVDRGETLQTISTDGGKTFSKPKSIGVWGLPSFLTKLGSGDLLMSYGYRRKPFGNQARLSRDHGQTWSDPMTISSDGSGGDLGYPSTVELSDKTLISVWYEKFSGSSKAVLRMSHWKIG